MLASRYDRMESFFANQPTTEGITKGDEIVVPLPGGNRRSRSKDQLETELDFSVGRGGGVNKARTVHRATIAGEHRAVIDGSLKIGMIEHIEELGAEL